MRGICRKLTLTALLLFPSVLGHVTPVRDGVGGVKMNLQSATPTSVDERVGAAARLQP
jgi:hypothetical protein